VLRRKIGGCLAVAVVLLASLALVGAGPRQSEVPPQPFFADFFSGVVRLQGSPAPAGTQLVACVDDCETFQSKPVLLTSGGAFHLLEVNPSDRFLRGDTISFYLVNAYGRIQAAESALFEGEYAIARLNLSFDHPLPTPLPLPMLPQVGDPVLPILPRAALALGTVMLAGGLALMMLNRRRMVQPASESRES
jgi:hypothetical protein